MRILGISVLIMLLIFSGCTQNSQPQNQSASQLASKSTAGEKTVENVYANESTNATARERLLRILEQQQKNSWRVEFENVDGNPAETVFLDQNNFYYGLHRKDGIETRTYFTSSGVFFCESYLEKWTCWRVTDSEEESELRNSTSILFLGSVTEVRSMNDSEILALPDLRIVGINAKCFGLVNSMDPDMINEVCFSDTGAPLFMELSGPGLKKGNITFVNATAYSSQFSKENLVLPATPIESN